MVLGVGIGSVGSEPGAKNAKVLGSIPVFIRLRVGLRDCGGSNSSCGWWRHEQPSLLVPIIHGCSRGRERTRPSGTLDNPGSLPGIFYPQPPQECRSLSAGTTQGHSPAPRFGNSLDCGFASSNMEFWLLSVSFPPEFISMSFSWNLKTCLDDPSSLGALLVSLCVSPVWCGW